MITFKSGNNKTRIYYFIVTRRDLYICKKFKTTPGECSTNQHGILVLDIRLKKRAKEINELEGIND